MSGDLLRYEAKLQARQGPAALSATRGAITTGAQEDESFLSEANHKLLTQLSRWLHVASRAFCSSLQPRGRKLIPDVTKAINRACDRVAVQEQ
jgi:hypothetical protein